jgi:hypothetical protein
MTTSTPPRQRRSANRDNDIAVLSVALQRVETVLAQVQKTLGETGFDEHGALIGTGIAGNLARLEQRVNRRFAIYDGVTRYAAGATATAAVMGALLWFVIKNKIEEFFK